MAGLAANGRPWPHVFPGRSQLDPTLPSAASRRLPRDSDRHACGGHFRWRPVSPCLNATQGFLRDTACGCLPNRHGDRRAWASLSPHLIPG